MQIFVLKTCITIFFLNHKYMFGNGAFHVQDMGIHGTPLLPIFPCSYYRLTLYYVYFLLIFAIQNRHQDYLPGFLTFNEIKQHSVLSFLHFRWHLLYWGYYHLAYNGSSYSLTSYLVLSISSSFFFTSGGLFCNSLHCTTWSSL